MASSDKTVPIESQTQTFPSGGKTIRIESFVLPDHAGRSPVLVLHGADGLSIRGAMYRGVAREVALAGHPAFVLHYFDRGGNGLHALATAPLHFMEWMETIRDGIGHALGRTGAAQAGLIGFSLGAYLALSVATQDERVAAVVDCFGGLPDLFDAQAAAMPPVLILHGDDDRVVPVSEALRLERELRARRRPVEIHRYPGEGHRLSATASADALQRTLVFLNRQLQRDRAAG